VKILLEIIKILYFSYESLPSLPKGKLAQNSSSDNHILKRKNMQKTDFAYWNTFFNRFLKYMAPILNIGALFLTDFNN